MLTWFDPAWRQAGSAHALIWNIANWSYASKQKKVCLAIDRPSLMVMGVVLFLKKLQDSGVSTSHEF